ncbi:MAG TPA: hypothetical protein VKV05_02205, partial [Terriglobales bacterium]|nr:hypothetical protein [Terriglobales bacterium]
IRAALNDKAERPVYVETIPRRGYRFLTPVIAETVPARPPQVIESGSPIAQTPAGAAENGEKMSDAEYGAWRLHRAAKYIAEERRSTGLSPERETALRDALVILANREEKLGATELAGVGQQASRRKPSAWLIAGLALLFLALVAIAGHYWRTQKVSALNEKDTVVLADFKNNTGDPVFDDTLKQGLAVELEQSPFLDLISDSKVNQTLKLMGRTAGDRLTPEDTREVCQRTGSRAMVIGSIAELGSQYVIGLKAEDCNTGDVMAEAETEATGKEKVLTALDAGASSLRSKLGESLSSVEKYATPLEQATTPSLEALKAYSLGRESGSAKGNAAALPFYKQAVELDPNFAMAYRAMSVSYANLDEEGRAAEYARKAYELREKVSERERFSIEVTYYLNATGDLEKAAQVCEQWQQTYPRDVSPYVNSGFIYVNLGNLDRALEEFREATRLEPNDWVNYYNLSITYVYLNRLDEAEEVCKLAEEHKLMPGSCYELAFLKGQTARMAQLVSAAMGRPGIEDEFLAEQADTEAWYGKMKNAKELTWRAMDSAQRNDAKEAAATYQASAALREVEIGDPEQAIADAGAAMKLSQSRDVQSMAVLALARAGDTARAEKLAAELDRTFPLDTLLQKYWLPTIRAAVALQRNNPSGAIEQLKVASAPVYEGATYLRGEAYLKLDDGQAAAAEFQKLIDYRGLVGNMLWGALARLGLARAYALQAVNDPATREKARTAYQNFFALWKDADSNIPIYNEAKAEYVRLQ